MNLDIKDNTIGFFTDMYVFSSDEDYCDEMSIQKKEFRNLMSSYLSDDEIDNIVIWGEQVFNEITDGDYDEDYCSGLLHWIILSWFYEMSKVRNLNICDYISNIIGRDIGEITIDGICDVSYTYYKNIMQTLDERIAEYYNEIMEAIQNERRNQRTL